MRSIARDPNQPFEPGQLPMPDPDNRFSAIGAVPIAANVATWWKAERQLLDGTGRCQPNHAARAFMEVCVFGPLFIAALIGAAPAPAAAQVAPSPPVRGEVTGYHFDNGIMASKANDQRLYVLLGSGFLRATSFGDPKIFVADWLKLHPKAIVTPISRLLSTNTRTHQLMELVYVWIEDGNQSLNVDMIRAGVFTGGTMYDMVDNEKGLDQLLKSDPKLADARAEIEKERAAAPQDRSERLIPDEEYGKRIARINEAEQVARVKKQGIWSDAMKQEREADGIR